MRISYAEGKVLYTRHGPESCEASSPSAVWHFPGVQREWLRCPGAGTVGWEPAPRRAEVGAGQCCSFSRWVLQGRQRRAQHPGKLQALLWGPLFRCYLRSHRLSYTGGISGALQPPAALGRAAAAALRFRRAVKHQNCCRPPLLPAGSQPSLAASLLKGASKTYQPTNVFVSLACMGSSWQKLEVDTTWLACFLQQSCSGEQKMTCKEQWFSNLPFSPAKPSA